MANYNFFDIKRRSPHRNITIVVNQACARGLAIMRSVSNPQQGVPASPADDAGVGAPLLGFLTRPVVDGGPTVIQRAQLYGDSPLVKELEQPFTLGQECSLEHADAVVVEGENNMVVGSGTGYIDDSTALGTRCGFYEGRFRVAQSGDDELYALTDISTDANTLLTAEGDGPRCRFERIQAA